MANSTIWWLMAGGAIALELLSGSIYLLLIGAAFAAAAISAHLGLGLPGQFVVAAAVGAGAVALWYATHRKGPGDIRTEASRDLNLDVGENIHVEAWNPDGTATVRYRGAQWTVVARAGNMPSPGLHRVAEVVGNRLVVDKV